MHRQQITPEKAALTVVNKNPFINPNLNQTAAMTVNRTHASLVQTADLANLCEMTRPPVRLAPSMLKQQSCRGSGRGFCRVISAASLRFCLGSPRICRTQTTLEEPFMEPF